MRRRDMLNREPDQPVKGLQQIDVLGKNVKV
jgi:hypothetical protein